MDLFRANLLLQGAYEVNNKAYVLGHLNIYILLSNNTIDTYSAGIPITLSASPKEAWNKIADYL